MFHKGIVFRVYVCVCFLYVCQTLFNKKTTVARSLASLVSFVRNIEKKMKFNILQVRIGTYVGIGQTHIKLNKKSQKSI